MNKKSVYSLFYIVAALYCSLLLLIVVDMSADDKTPVMATTANKTETLKTKHDLNFHD